MTEEGLQSITRFRDVGMIYKLKHIRNGVPDVNIGSPYRVVNIILLIVNRRDAFLIDELLIFFIPFMELTDPIQSIIMRLYVAYLAV
jgi:hypothetical protein